MARRKLQKFAEIRKLATVAQTPQALKGNWHKEFFGNENPLSLELGCGRGEYTVALAQMQPERNFIGIDVKGDRIWAGATKAQKHGLRNAGFMRLHINELTTCFAQGEVDALWITFPDPFERKSSVNRRLTSAYYLDLYRKVLKPEGIIEFKTDNTALFDFTLAVVRDQGLKIEYCTENLYAETLSTLELTIQTFYENKFRAQGETIKYLRFRLS